MRLLFVVESATDARLVEGLAERHDVTVLVRALEGGHEVSQALHVEVPVVMGPGGRVGFARWAAREVRRRPADVILVQGYGPAALAVNVAARSRPVRMLVCSPAEAYYRCRAAAAYPAKPFRRRELALLHVLAWANRRLGQGYVVLSQHLADAVGPTRLPVAIAPVYGVDLDVFSPVDTPRRAQRVALGLPPDGPLILFSSRVAPEKDAETLLDAMRTLRDDGAWLLHRSGGYAELLAAAEARGVADRVIATDAVDPRADLAADYRAADVCVQASRAEGLGFSPLEALACGTPVVAAAVGGLLETIVEGRTGWNYPAGDAEGLTSAIRAVFVDPADTARRVDAGQAMVRDYERSHAFDALDAALRRAVRR